MQYIAFYVIIGNTELSLAESRSLTAWCTHQPMRNVWCHILTS